MKKHLSTIFFVLIFFIGLSILLYPIVSDYINSLSQSRVVSDYKEKVSRLSNEEIEQMFAAADRYNQALAATSPRSFFDPDLIEGYENILDITGTGVMGYVGIKAIDVELPIYHTTEESVLQVGIGHLQGTSFPIGGASTHSVISGHRGLPSSKLFTDLDRLEVGDVFTMTTLNRTVTYEIDQIRIVEPEDVADLLIVDGEDLSTLFTCTPYGINSHRMLLRGHRIENLPADYNITSEAFEINMWVAMAAVGIPLLTAALIMLVIRNRRRRKQQELQLLAMEQMGLMPEDLDNADIDLPVSAEGMEDGE